MIKLFLKKNWPSLVITLVWAILTGLSKLEIDISWIKDINTWANAFILELYLFQLMSAITIKIKNQYWQSLISLMVSLFLGETIRYNFNLVDFSFMNLLGIFLFSLLTLMVTYQSFSLFRVLLSFYKFIRKLVHHLFAFQFLLLYLFDVLVF